MAKWIELAVNVSKYCPYDLCKSNSPNICHNTKEYNENYQVIGCRGITCEQCWNQESEEE